MPLERIELMIGRLTAFFVQSKTGDKKIKIEDFLLSENFQKNEIKQPMDFDKLDLSKLKKSTDIDYSFFRMK